MKLKSVFNNNEEIPTKYTCDGLNVNPPLYIENIPSEAVSLALIVDDPDAPNGTWVHWVLWNIDPGTTVIAENSVPKDSVEGITSFNRSGYGGPCPPSGTHRYFFKLYALTTKLDLSMDSSFEQISSLIRKNSISSVELIGLYSKK